MKRDSREKLYLKQIKQIDRAIVNKAADAEIWRERAVSLGSQKVEERVQSSGKKDSMRPADIAMDLERDIKALYAKRKEIVDVIQGLPAPYSDVLYKRYVFGMRHKEIAAASSDMTESNVTTAHGRGLQMVKKILDRREQNGQ